jgi:4-hydroxythreonine-4-phosphate dehydrogenase
MTRLPRVAVSMGDPRGIGPEVALSALLDPRVRAALQAVVFGDRAALEAAARSRALKGWRGAFELREVSALPALPDERAAGAAALAYVDAAARAVAAGEADALCTAPLSKHRVSLSRADFVGHTEYLSALAGARVAMMMAGPRLRVVLASTHLALAEVPRRLTREQIAFVIALTARELAERFGVPAPRIAVCGLNPHAGEGGLFGDEEARLIAPAVADARALGIDARGPLPADGLFPKAVAGSADAVVALYHDQGLIPAKLLDFRETVNVTLGLPWPRTSPDHGTADDLFGRGLADPEPMVSALLLAAKLGATRRR